MLIFLRLKHNPDFYFKDNMKVGSAAMKRIILFLLILFSFSSAQTENENNDFSYALKLYDQKFYDLAVGQFTKFYSAYPNNSNAPCECSANMRSQTYPLDQLAPLCSHATPWSVCIY